MWDYLGSSVLLCVWPSARSTWSCFLQDQKVLRLWGPSLISLFSVVGFCIGNVRGLLWLTLKRLHCFKFSLLCRTPREQRYGHLGHAVLCTPLLTGVCIYFFLLCSDPRVFPLVNVDCTGEWLSLWWTCTCTQPTLITPRAPPQLILPPLQVF